MPYVYKYLTSQILGYIHEGAKVASSCNIIFCNKIVGMKVKQATVTLRLARELAAVILALRSYIKSYKATNIYHQ
jgi:hypothetical protein